MPTVMLIKQSKEGCCKVTYINKLDLGGSVPAWVMNIALNRNLDLTFKIQQHFLQKLGKGSGDGADISAEDAQTLGLTSLWGESDRAALFFLRHFG